MSTRYIPQLNNENFVYPNYDLAEYDVDIIHVPNDNSVSGTVTSLSATTITSSAITLQYSGTWSLNGAERRLIGSNTIWLSIHVMVPGQDYYKPWRMTTYRTGGATITSQTFTNSNLNINTSTLQVSSFTSGTYYFEFRFIGGNSIYPVCQSLSITVP